MTEDAAESRGHADGGVEPLDPPAVQVQQLDGGDRPGIERGQPRGGSGEGVHDGRIIARPLAVGNRLAEGGGIGRV